MKKFLQINSAGFSKPIVLAVLLALIVGTTFLASQKNVTYNLMSSASGEQKYQFSAAGFKPGEKINTWASLPGGRSIALAPTAANSSGTVSFEVASGDDWPSGTIRVVAHGTQSNHEGFYDYQYSKSVVKVASSVTGGQNGAKCDATTGSLYTVYRVGRTDGDGPGGHCVDVACGQACCNNACQCTNTCGATPEEEAAVRAASIAYAIQQQNAANNNRPVQQGVDVSATPDPTTAGGAGDIAWGGCVHTECEPKGISGPECAAICGPVAAGAYNDQYHTNETNIIKKYGNDPARVEAELRKLANQNVFDGIETDIRSAAACRDGNGNPLPNPEKQCIDPKGKSVEISNSVLVAAMNKAYDAGCGKGSPEAQKCSVEIGKKAGILPNEVPKPASVVKATTTKVNPQITVVTPVVGNCNATVEFDEGCKNNGLKTACNGVTPVCVDKSSKLPIAKVVAVVDGRCTIETSIIEDCRKNAGKIYCEKGTTRGGCDYGNKTAPVLVEGKCYAEPTAAQYCLSKDGALACDKGSTRAFCNEGSTANVQTETITGGCKMDALAAASCRAEGKKPACNGAYSVCITPEVVNSAVINNSVTLAGGCNVSPTEQSRCLGIGGTPACTNMYQCNIGAKSIVDPCNGIIDDNQLSRCLLAQATKQKTTPTAQTTKTTAAVQQNDEQFGENVGRVFQQSQVDPKPIDQKTIEVRTVECDKLSGFALIDCERKRDAKLQTPVAPVEKSQVQDKPVAVEIKPIVNAAPANPIVAAATKVVESLPVVSAIQTGINNSNNAQTVANAAEFVTSDYQGAAFTVNQSVNQMQAEVGLVCNQVGKDDDRGCFQIIPKAFIEYQKTLQNEKTFDDKNKADFVNAFGPGSEDQWEKYKAYSQTKVTAENYKQYQFMLMDPGYNAILSSVTKASEIQKAEDAGILPTENDEEVYGWTISAKPAIALSIRNNFPNSPVTENFDDKVAAWVNTPNKDIPNIETRRSYAKSLYTAIGNYEKQKKANNENTGLLDAIVSTIGSIFGGLTQAGL